MATARILELLKGAGQPEAAPLVPQLDSPRSLPHRYTRDQGLRVVRPLRSYPCLSISLHVFANLQESVLEYRGQWQPKPNGAETG